MSEPGSRNDEPTPEELDRLPAWARRMFVDWPAEHGRTYDALPPDEQFIAEIAKPRPVKGIALTLEQVRELKNLLAGEVLSPKGEPTILRPRRLDAGPLNALLKAIEGVSTAAQAAQETGWSLGDLAPNTGLESLSPFELVGYFLTAEKITGAVKRKIEEIEQLNRPRRGGRPADQRRRIFHAQLIRLYEAATGQKATISETSVRTSPRRYSGRFFWFVKRSYDLAGLPWPGDTKMGQALKRYLAQYRKVASALP